MREVFHPGPKADGAPVPARRKEDVIMANVQELAEFLRELTDPRAGEAVREKAERVLGG